MAKKRPMPPVDMSTFGSEFDDVFNQLDPSRKEPSESSATVPNTTPKPPPPPATPADEVEVQSKRSKKKVPRKKKGAKPPASTSGDVSQSLPAPSIAFTREELNWFFSNPAIASQPKQLYVAENTKETLHHVARAAGMPIGHLTDNIVRWFLWANKAEIMKIIARNRNPLDRLDM